MASASVPTLQIPPAPRTLRRWRGVPTVPPVLVAAAVVYPWIANDYWTFNLTVGFTFAIACLGLYVLTGWAGQISLAQAGLVGTALYVSSFATRTADHGDGGLGLRISVAFGLAVAVAVVVSLVVAFASIGRAAMYTAVLTLALQFALQNAVFGTYNRLNPGMWDGSNPRPTPFGVHLESDQNFYWFVLAVLAVVLGCLYRLRHSRFGRGFIAVGANPATASVAGISPARYRAAAFCLAGALAGVAGGLEAPLFRGNPGQLSFDAYYSLVYVAVPLVAGFESATAVVLVAAAVQLVPQLVLEWRLTTYLVAGLGSAIGVLLGPRGLAGRLGDLVDGRGRRGR
jgi:branched-chain amino acid transport system permease protein